MATGWRSATAKSMTLTPVVQEEHVLSEQLV
jgi:hypothetical protein